jgi:hypothetical protein
VREREMCECVMCWYDGGEALEGQPLLFRLSFMSLDSTLRHCQALTTNTRGLEARRNRGRSFSLTLFEAQIAAAP